MPGFVDLTQVFRQRGHDAAVEIGVDQALDRFEGAVVFLAEPGIAEGAAFLVEEFRVDAWALGGGDVDARPVVAAPGPGVVEEAALAEGGGQADEAALGDGKHRPDRAVQVVGNAGGLVDDDQIDVGVAANGVLAAGEGNDAAEVLEFDLLGGAALEQAIAQDLVKEGDQAQQLLGLAMAARQDEDLGQAVEQGLDQGEDGDDGGLAGLSAAVEQQAGMAVFQHLDLPGIGLEAQQAHDFDGGGKVGGRGHGGVLCTGGWETDFRFLIADCRLQI